jgi:DNA polymerase elongation subunit (family B)
VEIEISKFKDLENSESYEVWDERQEKWVDFDRSCYRPKPIGFPSAETGDCEIVLITMQEIRTGRTFTFASRELQGEEVDTIYHHAKDEVSLLKQFLLFWNQSNVEVVTGWNIENFDMPYIANRISRILGEEWMKRLSPWADVSFRKRSLFGRERTVVDIAGISILDFQDLYKKFTYTKQESYSLAHISSIELEETKLEHDEFKSFNDFIDCKPYVEEISLSECKDESEILGRKIFLLDQDSTQGFQPDEVFYMERFLDQTRRSEELSFLQDQARVLCWNKFVRYNVRDVVLVTRLEDKLRLIDLAFTMAYKFKLNVTDIFGPVKMWDTIIHNTLFSEGVVIPLRESNYESDDDGIEGAYVKDPVPGLVNFFLTLDATSLYPSNAMTMNMSPETYLGQIDCNIERLLAGEQFKFPENVAVSPIGAMFSKEKRGIIPRLIENYMRDRKVAKGQMLSLESELEAIKQELARREQFKKGDKI